MRSAKRDVTRIALSSTVVHRDAVLSRAHLHRRHFARAPILLLYDHSNPSSRLCGTNVRERDLADAHGISRRTEPAAVDAQVERLARVRADRRGQHLEDCRTRADALRREPRGYRTRHLA